MTNMIYTHSLLTLLNIVMNIKKYNSPE